MLDGEKPGAGLYVHSGGLTWGWGEAATPGSHGGDGGGGDCFQGSAHGQESGVKDTPREQAMTAGILVGNLGFQTNASLAEN